MHAVPQTSWTTHTSTSVIQHVWLPNLVKPGSMIQYCTAQITSQTQTKVGPLVIRTSSAMPPWTSSSWGAVEQVRPIHVCTIPTSTWQQDLGAGWAGHVYPVVWSLTCAPKAFRGARGTSTALGKLKDARRSQLLGTSEATVAAHKVFQGALIQRHGGPKWGLICLVRYLMSPAKHQKAQQTWNESHGDVRFLRLGTDQKLQLRLWISLN